MQSHADDALAAARRGVDADVVIAGAGLAGLSCAAALSDLGLRVIVLEPAGQCGGRASSATDEATGDVVDIGPHVISTEHRNFLSLLERLGTREQVLWQPEPLITLLDAGRRLDMHASRWPPPLHALPNLPNALRCVSWRDLWSMRRLAWWAARADAASTLALDELDALTFLRRMGVSQRFIDWYWVSSTLSLLNVPLERCSAASLMRVFRLMLGRSGYHFGFARVGLGELFVPACRRIVRDAGGAVLMRTAVSHVLVREGRFEAVRCDDGRLVRARAAVLAVPPRELAQLAQRSPAARLPQPELAFFEPCPYVSTMLWFDRKLTAQRFWAAVVAPGQLNTDFYDLSNIRAALAEAPSLVVCNAIHAHLAATWRDDTLIERARRELSLFAPAAAEATLRHARVHRIPMAIACPLPGSETRRPGTRTAVLNLMLAGDWTATGLPSSMESAARSGLLAAEAVAALFGQRRRLAIDPPETTGLVAQLRGTA